MQYITYDEYAKIGGTLEESAFCRKISRVCAIIDNATQERIAALDNIPTAVKELCRDLSEYLAANDDTRSTVQSRSQSVGGVSESESYAAKTKEDITSHISSMVFDYLYSVKTKDGTSVLYRGCDI